MSCKACEQAQHGTEMFAFRWKNANIILVGCREHIGEVMEALRKAQDDTQKSLTWATEALGRMTQQRQHIQDNLKRLRELLSDAREKKP